MTTLVDRPELIRVADLVRGSENDRSVRRAHAVGLVIRLIRGCYVRQDVWDALGHDERHLLRIAAVARSSAQPPVFSHWSAAAIWGYPILGAWPDTVHVAVGSGNGRRSAGAVVRHVVDVADDEIQQVAGVLVTSRLRTVNDVARAGSFAAAVAVYDRALRDSVSATNGPNRLTRQMILGSLARQRGGRGTRLATAAAEFADHRADNPGESLSRVVIHRLRMPAPELQVPVRDAHGRLHFTDFGWEEALGEFDGRHKYSRDEYTRGRPPEEVVWTEKLREDAIRNATGKPMVRWVWDHLQHPAKLERVLRGAGLHPTGD